jgi:hypothetical protein
MLQYDDKAEFVSFMRERRYNMDVASLDWAPSDCVVSGVNEK